MVNSECLATDKHLFLVCVFLIMKLEEFKHSLVLSSPPPTITEHLKALWYDANGNWEKSHQIIQDIEDANAAWIHAYLHRKEGDIGNADYWYRRAGKKRPAVTLEEEWDIIAKELIK
jgi:hypothetical protein